jgi:hypothetical protein
VKTDLVRDVEAKRALDLERRDRVVEQVIDELEDLEARARAVILRRPSRRAVQLAALMNWLIFGRWPGRRP